MNDDQKAANIAYNNELREAVKLSNELKAPILMHYNLQLSRTQELMQSLRSEAAKQCNDAMSIADASLMPMFDAIHKRHGRTV